MTIGRFVMVLTTVCAVSGFGLSFFYSVTRPLIERNRAARELRFKQALVPAAAEFRVRSGSVPYRAVEDAVDSSGALAGVLVRDVCRGYGGDIEYVAAFVGSSATLLGVRVLSHRETPGLGAKVVSPGFLQRFIGKAGSALLLSRDGAGGTVDALSGATITSRAIAGALARVSADPGLVPPAASPVPPEQPVSSAPVKRPLPRRRPEDGAAVSTGAAVGTSREIRLFDGGGTAASMHATVSSNDGIRIAPAEPAGVHDVRQTTAALRRQLSVEPSSAVPGDPDGSSRQRSPAVEELTP